MGREEKREKRGGGKRQERWGEGGLEGERVGGGGGLEGDVREAGYISDGPQVYVVMEKKHRFLLSPLGREN